MISGTSLQNDPSADKADLNLRIVTSLAWHIRDTHGEAALQGIARHVGLESADLEAGTRWVSSERMAVLLAKARELYPSDDAFRRACAYRFAESYRALRFMTWALTPAMVYVQSARRFPAITSISETEVVRLGKNRVRCIYRSQKPESRELCLSRQGQLVVLPTLWGLPQAQFVESACLSRGDDRCEYDIEWLETRRAWAPLVGAGLAAAVWPLLSLLEVGGLGLLPWLMALGVVTGYAFGLRRSYKKTVALAEDLRQAAFEIASESAKVNQELMELRGREHKWNRMLHEQLSERAAVVAEMVNELEERQEQQAVAMRGLTHDIRNPMTVLKGSISYLEAQEKSMGDNVRDMLKDLKGAVDNMDGFLVNLLDSIGPAWTRLPWHHRSVDVAPLSDIYRRRLQALTFERGMEATATCTPDAPEQIRIDPLLLDRIADNLFTNAAKYTSQGSLHVELGGKPGFLCLKVSDTGCGISPERLDEIFEPRPTPDPRKGVDSHGEGLSVVVQLLAQVGGRLEVKSAPETGTTFWVWLPVDASRASADGASAASATEVVSVRR